MNLFLENLPKLCQRQPEALHAPSEAEAGASRPLGGSEGQLGLGEGSRDLSIYHPHSWACIPTLLSQACANETPDLFTGFIPGPPPQH